MMKIFPCGPYSALYVFLVCALFCGEAVSASFCADQHQGQLNFIPTYEELAVEGRFRRFSVRLGLNGDQQPENLDVLIDMASATLYSGDIDQEIHGDAWFDSVTYPTARFSAEDVSISDKGVLLFAGQLILKGVQQAVTVPLSLSEDQDEGKAKGKDEGKDENNGASGTLVLKGEVALNRMDFEIGTGEWSSDDQIGHNVAITFTVRMHACD